MGSLVKLLFTFSTTDRIEKVHPLQSGILRLKHPSERRSGLPRESAWRFWPLFIWETIKKHAALAGVMGQLLLWKTMIARNPHAGHYMDQALVPDGEDGEALDLITMTSGGRAAVAHVKMIAKLTSTA